MKKIDDNSDRARISKAPAFAFKLVLALAFLFCLSTLLASSSAQTKRPANPRAGTSPTPVPQNPNANRKGVGPVIGPQRGAVVVPQQPPKLELIVDRDHAQVGEILKFTLTPPSLVLRSKFVFTMDFGDRTPPVQQPNSTEFLHEYRSNGDFTAAVTVSPPPGNQTLMASPAMKKIVTVHIEHAQLFVTPSVELGQHLAFTTTRLSQDFRYRFVFGDTFFPGDWQELPQATHVYFVPNTYQAHVEIGRMLRGVVLQVDSSEPKPIEVKAPAIPAVSFTVSPAPVVAGSPATFVAESVFSDPNVRYRFDFGDSSPPSEWREMREASHTYSPGGPYTAFAEMAVLNRGVMTTIAFSAKKQITVASRSTGGEESAQASVTPKARESRVDPWLKLLIVAVLVLAVASSVLKWGFSAHPPTFHPHPDDGAADVNVRSNSLGIDYQIALNRNLGKGHFEIHWDTSSLIASIRREDG
jgi:hypothetical protein